MRILLTSLLLLMSCSFTDDLAGLTWNASDERDAAADRDTSDFAPGDLSDTDTNDPSDFAPGDLSDTDTNDPSDVDSGGADSVEDAVPDPLKTVLMNISQPSFEFTMDAVDRNGRMFNTGWLAPDYNADLNSCATTVDPVDGFDGYVDMDGVGDNVRSDFDGYPKASDLLRTQDRSYVLVWDIDADIASDAYLSLCTAETGWPGNGWGWLYTNSSGQLKSQYLFGSAITDLKGATGTGINDTGTATDLATTGVGGTPRRTILAVTYEHATGDTVIRWKQTGNGVGHTYIAGTSPSENPAGAPQTTWMGWHIGAATVVQWRYLAVVDVVLSSSEFESLADAANL